MRQSGIALISALIFLLIMLLIVSANLFISQMSIKSAQAAQQQLLFEQRALALHLSSVSDATLDSSEAELTVASRCPASYAVWSESIIDCDLFTLATSLLSDDSRFATSYHTMLLRQQIAEGEVLDAD
jgi:Tfp pilus assembly protein PilV